MHSDPIADLLTRIRNAAAAGHSELGCPHSRIKEDIVRLLTKTGYLDSYEVTTTEKGFKKLMITLKPEKRTMKINRISTPGQRIYADAKHLPNVLRGLGIAVLTTSQGLMTNEEAKKAKVGGEVLLEVW